MASPSRVEEKGQKVKIQLEMEIPGGATLMECKQLALVQLNEADRMAAAGVHDTFRYRRLSHSGGRCEIHYQGLSGKATKLLTEKYRSHSKCTKAAKEEPPIVRWIARPGSEQYHPSVCSNVSRKYGALQTAQAQQDMREFHGREVSCCYL